MQFEKGALDVFKIGDYVIYGSEGVCLIEDIRTIAFDRIEEKPYYVLKPRNKKGAGVFFPCDSDILNTRMRRVLNAQEIHDALDRIRGKRLPWIDDRKRRTALFKSIRNEMRCEKLILMIRCIELQKRLLESEGKKLSFSDSDALSTATALVTSELSYVLDIPAEEVGSYIRDRLRSKTVTSEE